MNEGDEFYKHSGLDAHEVFECKKSQHNEIWFHVKSSTSAYKKFGRIDQALLQTTDWPGTT